ncbi:MAG: amidohydrolase family protein [Myxococcota bacterium]
MVVAAYDAPPVCACHLATDTGTAEGSPLEMPFDALDDEEGAALPAGLPPVVDAHVHLFPDRLFEAIWAWFDEHAWPIRYRLRSPEVIRFLLSRGVDRIVALHYAHKPGMARGMNRWMAELCRREPRVTGLATVFPGEPDSGAILDEAFADGLAGVKLHAHVQRVSADDPALEPVYRACVRWDRPLLFHLGREPASPAYGVDTRAICSVERTEHVLRAFPDLRLCVPHLGADEFEGYLRLLERYDNLWLDTTMLVAGFFPLDVPVERFAARPDRLLYGTDFPNIPYAWDREIRLLADMDLPEHDLARILGETARDLFGLP